MGFASSYDNPRRERCLPESNGIDASHWSSAELEDGDSGYWLETVDMAEAFDAEINAGAWAEVEFVASVEGYRELRRAAIKMLGKARTPRQVYAVIAMLPSDFFEIEDRIVNTHTWIDGQPLSRTFYTIESRSESQLKAFRHVQRKQSRTVKVLDARQTPIRPVLARKGGKILRPQTREQLRTCIDAGFKIYTQEDIAYAN